MNGFLLTGGFVGNLPSRRLNSQFIHLDFYSFEFPNSINENDTFKRSAVLIRSMSIADVRKRIMVAAQSASFMIWLTLTICIVTAYSGVSADCTSH